MQNKPEVKAGLPSIYEDTLFSSPEPFERSLWSTDSLASFNDHYSPSTYSRLGPTRPAMDVAVKFYDPGCNSAYVDFTAVTWRPESFAPGSFINLVLADGIALGITARVIRVRSFGRYWIHFLLDPISRSSSKTYTIAVPAGYCQISRLVSFLHRIFGPWRRDGDRHMPFIYLNGRETVVEKVDDLLPNSSSVLDDTAPRHVI